MTFGHNVIWTWIIGQLQVIIGVISETNVSLALVGPAGPITKNPLFVAEMRLLGDAKCRCNQRMDYNFDFIPQLL